MSPRSMRLQQQKKVAGREGLKTANAAPGPEVTAIDSTSIIMYIKDVSDHNNGR